MTSKLGCGFVYALTVADKKTGAGRAQCRGNKNRVPLEGLNDIADSYLKGGAGPSALYIGLWSGAHIPDGSETAANLASLVSEVTNYTQPGRLVLTLGDVAGGACNNAASLARFDMQGTATVNGAFISTTQAKGAATGRLLSVVRFFNPRAVDATVYLEVLSGFQFVSL